MRFSHYISLLLLLLTVYWSFHALMPSYPDNEGSASNFSTDRALTHVKNIAQKPHAVGFGGHVEVRNYIMAELKKLGLNPQLQKGYTIGDWGNMSRATNILARIKGTGSEKALMLLSHYDSNPHSSHGASDAGSGVATILEGVRAYLADAKTPKNDIIILISDAEELGLNGADLFVNQHPWAKDVGLVLNFEARGSGGPSYMLIETNRGNGKLIKEFAKASTSHPVTNSLAYSIYKLLPNDTDLTVFREDADIDGFNFAFIDDHFDYHTALDTYERLDRNTLAHQGTYLMPLLKHFSDTDISNMKSLDDYVYFNVPFFKLVHYPFEYIWPLFALAAILFIVLLTQGVKKKSLDPKGILVGFIPFIVALITCGFLGYVAWPMLKGLYPGYQDLLHGFTYNGHGYIYVFAFISLSFCFLIYGSFKKISKANLLIAPITIWLIICLLTNLYLKGASFFVIPVFGLLAGLLVHNNQKEPSPYLLVFLTLPAIFILVPFVKMFPVGLGLKMLLAATLFVALIFGLALPFLVQIRRKKSLGSLFLVLGIIFMVSAHLKSGFTKDRPKPSSLVYILNTDNGSAHWATYDKVTIPWNGQFLNTDQAPSAENDEINTISSKYSARFTRISNAPIKNIAPPLIEVRSDTIIDADRHLTLCISPRRKVNRLEIYTENSNIVSATVNDIRLPEYYLRNRGGSRLLTHYISDNDDTRLELTLPRDSKLDLTFYEASNDLLENELFSIPERPETSIPMPFVLNDAIMTIKSLTIE